MHLGHSNGRAEYTMKDNDAEIPLDAVSEEKDLGVWIDDKLKSSIHVGHAATKGNQFLGLIKRMFVYKDNDVVKRLFTSLIQAHLENANVVFHPRYKKDMDQLERVQRRATKLASGLHNMFENYGFPISCLSQIQVIWLKCRNIWMDCNSLHSDSILKKDPLSPLRDHNKLLKRQCSNILVFIFSPSKLWAYGTVFWKK